MVAAVYWIIPTRHAFKLPRFVNDPSPRHHALLACFFKQAIDLFHFGRRHGSDFLGDEQLVTDATASDRRCGLH
jgi:hypothetical protein